MEREKKIDKVLKPSQRIKEKECYRLWIEYLRRSEKYKLFCEWISEAQYKEDLPIPIEINPYTSDLNYEIFNRLSSYYRRFGDIYRPTFSFEKWYKTWEARDNIHPMIRELCEHFTPDDAKTVVDISDRIEDYIEYSQIDGKYRSELFLKIRGNTTANIINQVKHIIKKKKSELEKLELHDKIVRLEPSKKHLRVDELQRYLDVYDLRKEGFKPGEVILKINPNNDDSDSDVQRAYRDFYEKAKKIIGFVEQGIFPGHYDETTMNRKKRNAKK